MDFAYGLSSATASRGIGVGIVNPTFAGLSAWIMRIGPATFVRVIYERPNALERICGVLILLLVRLYLTG